MVDSVKLLNATNAYNAAKIPGTQNLPTAVMPDSIDPQQPPKGAFSTMVEKAPFGGC